MKYGCRRNQKKKESRNNYIREVVSPSLTSSSSSPHCVIELSNRLYKRMKNNIIMLNGLNNSNTEKLIQYRNATYGSNVKFRDINGVKVIDIPRMRHSCMMIATNKKECISMFKEKIYVIDTDITTRQ